MCNVTNHSHVDSTRHLTLAKHIRTDVRGRARYSISMRLPAHDDHRSILRFLGLNDEMIEVLMGRLDGGMGTRTSAGGSVSNDVHFAVVDELLSLYLSRTDTAHGLTPDLAASCGRIEISSYFTRQMAPGTTQFFSNRISPDYNTIRQDADRIVKKNAALLKDLWEQQQQASEVNTGENM